jgi:transcription elongation GreA/GreB family factor
MTGRRLHAAYIRAHGGTFVAGENASTLNSTISSAVRNRIFIEDAPLGEPGIRPRTYRLPGQPEARLRILGPRPFEDVPPLELARIVAAMREERGSHGEADVYRTVLERLGGSTPPTADVARRFAEVARLIPRAARATTSTVAGSAEGSVTPRATPTPKIPSTPRRSGGPATQTASGRAVPLSVGAMERLSSEASWIAKWLKEDHDLAGADRHAVQVERRVLNETRNRYVGRLDELQKILRESVIDPTYEPSDVVSPGVIVKICRAGGSDVERVLVTCQRDLPDGIEAVSPLSTLGEALSGAMVGQTLTFVHDGRERTVTVVAVRDS